MIYFAAEIFNSLSLTILGGVVYAYAVDNSGNVKNANSIFNKMNKLEFLFMGIFSMIGAVMYMIDPKLPWILAGLFCLILSVIGFWYLPAPVNTQSNKKISIISTFKELKYINSKLLIEGFNLALLLAFFQVILQYWQVMIDDVFKVSLSGLLYGILFSLILFSQSFSGYISAKFNIKIYSSILAFAITLFMAACAYFDNGYLFSIFLIILFGTTQSVIALSRSIYHNLSSSHNSSIYESFVTTFSKLLCIILLPLVSYSAEIFEWKNVIIVLSFLTLFNICLRVSKGRNENIV